MNEKKKVIAEPIFDDDMMDSIQNTDEDIIIDMDTPLPIPISVGPPTTKHYSELMKELYYYPYRGRSLLRNLYQTTLATGIYVSAKMIVPGVWEIGETADYEIKVRNYTGFDLEDVKANLYVQNVTGSASIVSPPGSYLKIGDIKYTGNGTTTFKIKAVTGGDVMLRLRIDGLMGSYKRRLYFNGRYWNGTAWTYKNPYHVKYHIYG